MRNEDSFSIEELLFELSGRWCRDRNAYNSDRANGVFSAAITVWLMMVQRISASSLRDTLDTLSNGIAGLFLQANTTSKVLRLGSVPKNTGGLNKARQRLSLQSLWDLFEQIKDALFKSEKQSTYLLDGFVITASHSLRNIESFGQHKTPKGRLHYPKIQLVTAHSLDSGKAIRPSIGTIKENEVRLSFSLFSRVKEPSLFVADRGFGLFAVVHAAHSNNHTVLFRLTDKRCKALCGRLPKDGERVSCAWSPSADTKRTFPELKEAPSIPGYVIACVNKGDRNKRVYFFTTSKLSAHKLCKLYERRLEVETYIRQLKQTLALEFVISKTPEMIEKEIVVAFITFNLLCDIINRAAKALEISPRRISFSSLLTCIQSLEPALLIATSPAETKLRIERFLQQLYASKIPIRSKTRSYPRMLRRGKPKYPIASSEQSLVLAPDRK
jgi:hypothetical protein